MVKDISTQGSPDNEVQDLMDQALLAYRKGDFGTAERFLQNLADRGVADAQFWLGALYANGEGVPADPKQAHDWCRRAALQGHAMAQANLAGMLIQGFGVEQDETEAKAWLEKAAKQNDALAAYELATLCMRGTSTPEDPAAAARWYHKAATLGHYPSQARLGYLLANGIGVEKDRALAFLWLSLAAQHGVGSALKLLEEISTQMSQEEKQKGKQLFMQLHGKFSNGPARLNPIFE